MKCQKCGFDNLEEATFCIKCGSRLDGKIPCPKCGEYISNDEEHCPHCGKHIPHKSQSVITKDEQNYSVKKKIAHIFNYVSCFVTLFLFIAFMGVAFSSHLHFVSREIQRPEFLMYFVYQFEDFAAVSNAEKSLMIIRAVIFAIDMIVTFTFSIIGIVKTSKSFRNRDAINNAYKYLAVVLAAKYLTTSLLLSTYSDGVGIYVTDHIGQVEIFTLIHITICLAFDCFLSFRRGQISIFIARIILGLGFYLPIIMLAAFGKNDAYTSLEFGSEGFIAHFVYFSEALAIKNYTDGFISSYILAAASVFLTFVIISVTYSIVVFLISSYFRGMNKFKKFRIIFYMAIISLAILSTAYLVSTIVECALFSNYMGMDVNFPTAPITAFVCSALLMGVAVTTFNIYNRANRRSSLSERTTLVD